MPDAKAVREVKELRWTMTGNDRLSTGYSAAHAVKCGGSKTGRRPRAFLMVTAAFLPFLRDAQELSIVEWEATGIPYATGPRRDVVVWHSAR